jgi:CubicO group peptidase (beta-lactamase class C family)
MGSFCCRYLSLFFLISILFIANTSHAQTSQQNEIILSEDANLVTEEAFDLAGLERFIDGYVNAMINDFDPPGMMVSVVIGDQQITKGYGIADAKTGRLVDERTGFRIGSISKLFVWLSAHRLADEGKLDLDADINNYLDGFQIDYAFGKPITMRDLMAHRPGFDDNIREFLDSDRNISLREAVMRNIPLQVAPPGERTSYSNTGTNIAAYIVEQVAETSYYDYVKSQILQPLGLNSTSLKDPVDGRINQDLITTMAKPHKIKNGIAEVAKYMAIRPQEPVGAVAMNALDAATFMRFLLNETRYDGGQLLSQPAWQRVNSNAFEDAKGSDDMGWGFMLTDVDGYKAVGHGGATQFLSYMFVIPELNFGVFVSSNATSAEAQPVRLVMSIARQISGTGSTLSFLQLEGDPQAAQSVAGDYLNNRRPQSRGASIFGMGADINVRATEDGFLIFPGEKETRYAPLGNDVWVSKVGFRLRVVRDEAGNVIRLHSSAGSSTLERIGFLSTKKALVIGFGGVFLLTLTSLLGMYYRHKRSLSITDMGNKLAWFNIASVAVWLMLIVSLLLVSMDMQNFDIATIDEKPFPPFFVSLVFFLTIVITIQAILHLTAMVPAWTQSGWTLWRKIHFSIYGIFAAFALYLMLHWNLVGGSIYGL